MSKKKILNILISLLFYSSVIFPTILINKIVFLILLTVSIFNGHLVTYSPVIVFLFFLQGFAMSLIGYSEIELSIQFFISISILFIINIIVWYKIDLDILVKRAGLLISFVTASFYFLIIYGGEIISADILSDFFFKFSAGAHGNREILGNEAIELFHMGSVPFLLISFSLYFNSLLLEKRVLDFFSLLLILLVILLSNSRGLIISSIIALILISVLYLKIKTRIIFISIVIPFLLLSLIYISLTTNIFNTSEESNSIKIGHFVSFIDNINLKNFLFGDGLASYYYSKGRNSFLTHTELTPIDTIRYLGFFQAIIVFFALIFPVLKVNNYKGKNRVYLLIFLQYIVFSITNPILFNSFGLLIVLWYWSNVLKSQ